MGLRLKQLRDALGLTQQAFGEWARVGSSTIAGWESGRNMIDLVHLAWAAQDLGFSTDFVARGDLGGLRHDLAVKIQEAQRATIGADMPRRGRPPASVPPASDSASAPLVRDVPDAGPRPPRHRMHEAPAPFIGKPPTRPV